MLGSASQVGTAVWAEVPDMFGCFIIESFSELLISDGVPSSHGSGAHVFTEPLTDGRSHADGLDP